MTKKYTREAIEKLLKDHEIEYEYGRSGGLMFNNENGGYFIINACCSDDYPEFGYYSVHATYRSIEGVEQAIFGNERN